MAINEKNNYISHYLLPAEEGSFSSWTGIAMPLNSYHKKSCFGSLSAPNARLLLFLSRFTSLDLFLL
jgi:hypothetical protein